MLFTTLEGLSVGYYYDFIGIGIFAYIVTYVGTYIKEYTRLICVIVELVSAGFP